MSSPTPHPRRLQLHLSDLLFAAFLCGAVCTLLVPRFFSISAAADPGLPYPTVATPHILPAPFVVGILATLIGAIPALLIGHRYHWRLARRWLAAGFYGVVLILPASALYNLMDSPLGREHFNQEPSALAACKAYCMAQNIYLLKDYDGDGILEYSQTGSGKFSIGDPNIALIHESLAAAMWGEGQMVVPKRGYIFKILKSRSSREYSRNSGSYFDAAGNMTEGYALIAAPAVYGLPGCGYTFLVSNAERIYCYDFGARTPEYFKNATEFDPLDSDVKWIPAE